MMANPNLNRGFTLIEVMIVVVIIGVLASLAIPRFNLSSWRAKEKEADGVLKQVYTLSVAYSAANSQPAATLNDLVEVGWEAPNASLGFYDPPPNDISPLSAGGVICMQPQTPGPRIRCIDGDGILDTP